MKGMNWLVIVVVAFTCACNTPPATSVDPDGGAQVDGNVPMEDAIVPPTDDGMPPVDAFLPMEDAGPPGCSSDADCNDDINCTADSCITTSGECRHIVTPALCAAGESCNPTTGCEMGSACATDADCADTDACTSNERCDPAARVCTFQPLDGDYDGDPPRVCGGTDCDDSKSFVYTGAPDRCNSIDDDCDGVIDDGADVACGDRHVCDTGACVCQAAYATCFGSTACIDLTTNASHCGACGQGCGPGGTCSGGTCSCPSGLEFCGFGYGCVNTVSNPGHCGSCTNACAEREGCAGNTCVAPCGGTRQPCCSDYPSCNTDACSSGVCGGCEPPLSFCGALCKDTRSDAANCGTCGNICSGTTPFCVSGSCTCPTGRTTCGSTCVDLLTEASSCGTCGHACGTSEFCSAGTCTSCGTDGALCCPGGPLCASGNASRYEAGVCYCFLFWSPP